MMRIQRDRGDAPKRFTILSSGMLSCGFAVSEAPDPHICFATSEEERHEEEGPPSSEPAGRKIPSACQSCGVQNEEDAKYCKGCGSSMATEPMDEEEEEAPPSSEEPEPSSAAPGHHPPPPARAVNASAAYEELAGVPRGSSVPVIKGALAAKIGALDHAMTALGVTDPERFAAAFDVMAKDAARIPGLESTIRAHEGRIKLGLAHKIVALKLDGYPRDELLEDVVEGGKRTVRLAKDYQRKSVVRMEELYARLKPRAKKQPDGPFAADRKSAAEAARNGGSTRAERVEAAKTHPTVVRMFNDPNKPASRTLEQIAEAFVDTEDAPVGAVATGGKFG